MSLFTDNSFIYRKYCRLQKNWTNQQIQYSHMINSTYCNQLYFYTLAKKCEKKLKTAPCTIASKILRNKFNQGRERFVQQKLFLWWKKLNNIQKIITHTWIVKMSIPPKSSINSMQFYSNSNDIFHRSHFLVSNYTTKLW